MVSSFSRLALIGCLTGVLAAGCSGNQTQTPDSGPDDGGSVDSGSVDAGAPVGSACGSDTDCAAGTCDTESAQCSAGSRDAG